MDHKELFSGCQINETMAMNQSNISLEVCVLPLHLARKNDKTQHTRTESRVRDEGNYADYAFFKVQEASGNRRSTMHI